jgi:hypothetical protein
MVSACLRCRGSLNQDFGFHALGIVFHFNAAGVEEHFGACDTRDGGEGFFNFLDARRAAQFITAKYGFHIHSPFGILCCCYYNGRRDCLL